MQRPKLRQQSKKKKGRSGKQNRPPLGLSQEQALLPLPLAAKAVLTALHRLLLHLRMISPQTSGQTRAGRVADPEVTGREKEAPKEEEKERIKDRDLALPK